MRKVATYLTMLTIGLFVVMQGQARAAEGQIKVGVLTCKGGAGVGLILGSKKSYSCTYAPTKGRPPESYRATVTKIGLDIGITGKTVIVWTVLASSAPSGPGLLAGNYAGVAADVALGIGGGAKVLVGGSKNSVILQPLSLQGQTGINLAVGISGMKLR